MRECPRFEGFLHANSDPFYFQNPATMRVVEEVLIEVDSILTLTNSFHALPEGLS